jgi:hypothetical protein
MAHLTYLQIVQRVLSMLNGDSVTSIDETVEAEQVAELVKHVYSDIIVDFPWFHKRSFINLEVTTTAHLMKIPDGVEQLLGDVIYYDDDPVYWMKPEAMKDMLAKRDKTLANVDANGAINDKAPKYWSSFDDVNVVFDSYDGSLVSSLTSIWTTKFPSAPVLGTDIPDLPHDLHMTLLHGVLAEAFRTQKGDEVAARGYENKYMKSKAKAKRWAQKVNKENDPGGKINYARRGTRRSRQDIPTWLVQEGS